MGFPYEAVFAGFSLFICLTVTVIEVITMCKSKNQEKEPDVEQAMALLD